MAAYSPPFTLTHAMLSRVSEIAELVGQWRFAQSSQVPMLRRENRIRSVHEARLKTPELIVKVLREEPNLTLNEVAERIGKSARTIERSASALVKAGRLRLVGPRKSGRWEVLEAGSQQL